MSLVYCVEDDENIRELVRYALCSQKFQAEAFPDGPSFWKAMEEKSPTWCFWISCCPEKAAWIS